MSWRIKKEVEIRWCDEMIRDHRSGEKMRWDEMRWDEITNLGRTWDEKRWADAGWRIWREDARTMTALELPVEGTWCTLFMTGLSLGDVRHRWSHLPYAQMMYSTDDGTYHMWGTVYMTALTIRDVYGIDEGTYHTHTWCTLLITTLSLCDVRHCWTIRTHDIQY